MTGNKINWQDLAAELATNTGMQRKDAEAFVRTFFDTLGKSILEEKSVKVKALGTFKMVEVQDRESVNVNTGERFTISGHAKIGFLPDSALKELVNKPFADFQTVILNEGTTSEDMERIDKKYPSTGLDEEEEITLPAEDVPNSDEQEELGDKNKDEGNIETQTEEEAVLTQEQPTADGEPQVQESSSDTPTKESSPTEKSSNESQEDKENQQNDTPCLQQSEKPVVIKAAEVTTSQAENATAEVETATRREERTTAEEPIAIPPVQENISTTTQGMPSVQQDTIQPKHNIWRTLFLTLVGLLLMIACYMAGYVRLINMSWLCLPPADDNTGVTTVPMSEEQTPVSTQAADSIPATQPQGTTSQEPKGKKEQSANLQSTPKETVPAPVKKAEPSTQAQEKARQEERSKQLQAAKNYPQVEGGKYLITGIRKTRVMQRGENLYRMARQEYGDKSVVEYIKALNQFPNPDNIPMGYEVKLPQLTKKTE